MTLLQQKPEQNARFFVKDGCPILSAATVETILEKLSDEFYLCRFE